MPNVACPSCGERGKIPPTLIGARIKCKKCGSSFTVSPPAAKAAVEASPGGAPAVAAQAAGTSAEGIAIEGLDDSAWAVAPETSDSLRAPAEAEPEAAPEGAESAPKFVAQEPTGFKEYKLLTAHDKFFKGKFELGLLEEALNHYARQGWVAKAMATPHVKGYTGGMVEELVVLLER
jgi:hypothetical protein